MSESSGLLTSPQITNVSQLVNDSGYLTDAGVRSIVTSYGYQTDASVRNIITSYGYQTSSQVSSAVGSYTAAKAAVITTSVNNTTKTYTFSHTLIFICGQMSGYLYPIYRVGEYMNVSGYVIVTFAGANTMTIKTTYDATVNVIVFASVPVSANFTYW